MATFRPRRLVLVGSVIADLMVTVPHLPERGGDVLASAINFQAGGGFNVLAAAHRLGMPVALAGRVGDGPMGQTIQRALAGIGCPALFGVSEGRDSGSCMGFIEPDGERTFVTSPGVESALGATDLEHVQWAADDAVYVSGYDLVYPETGPAVAQWAQTHRPDGLVLDPGPLIADIHDSVLAAVLKHTWILTLNARELELLDPGRRADDAEQPLLDRLLVGALLVARRGADGAVLHRRDQEPVVCQSRPVEVVDSTGAGDAHTGALVALLGVGLDPAEAAARATIAAAIAVSHLGSATGPTREELDQALADGTPETP